VTRAIGRLTSSRVRLCARQSVSTGLWIVKPRSRINQFRSFPVQQGQISFDEVCLRRWPPWG